MIKNDSTKTNLVIIEINTILINCKFINSTKQITEKKLMFSWKIWTMEGIYELKKNIADLR